ncbi:MAG: hypothetical protein JSU70_03905 [Phycisphaerales bacterium]|nr:MAG: hypothetical protein JSU70_03905 [Phycisphaerales bacterium]
MKQLSVCRRLHSMDEPWFSSGFGVAVLQGRINCLGEVKTVKRLEVKNRSHIKQLLYCGSVLGVKNTEFRSFGGFQLWWYDRKRGLCDCCESRWSDPRKRLAHYSLDEAARILWHNRSSLFLRCKHLPQDRGLQKMERIESVGH